MTAGAILTIRQRANTPPSAKTKTEEANEGWNDQEGSCGTRGGDGCHRGHLGGGVRHQERPPLPAQRRGALVRLFLRRLVERVREGRERCPQGGPGRSDEGQGPGPVGRRWH